MSFLRAILAAVVVGLFTFTAHADEASDKADLARIEGELGSILVKSDAAAFESKLAADWKVVLADGAMMTRQEIVSYIKSGRLRFSAYTVDELDSRIYGDVAVVIGVDTSRGAWDGQEFS